MKKKHISTLSPLNCDFWRIWCKYYLLLSFPPNKMTLPSRWVVRWNPVIGFGSFGPFSQTPVAGSNICSKYLIVHHTGNGCCLWYIVSFNIIQNYIYIYYIFDMNTISLPQHCPANILFHFFPSLLLRWELFHLHIEHTHDGL